TVIVLLVATFVHVLLLNSRTWYRPEAGTVKQVTVALVTPVAGTVFVPVRKHQCTYVSSGAVSRYKPTQSVAVPGPLPTAGLSLAPTAAVSLHGALPICTVIVLLVATFVNVLLLNSRTWYRPEAGTVKQVTVAWVTPVAGAVF